MKVKVYVWNGRTGRRDIVEDDTQPIIIKGIRYETRKKPVDVVFKAERSELRIAEVPDGFHKYSLHNADILTTEDLHLTDANYGDEKVLRFIEIQSIRNDDSPAEMNASRRKKTSWRGWKVTGRGWRQ